MAPAAHAKLRLRVERLRAKLAKAEKDLSERERVNRIYDKWIEASDGTPWNEWLAARENA